MLNSNTPLKSESDSIKYPLYIYESDTINTRKSQSILVFLYLQSHFNALLVILQK